LLPELASIADSIREIEACNTQLSDKTVGNVIAIAKCLGAVRPVFKHGEWGPWLASEFKWSARTSARYYSVFKLSEDVTDLTQLNISVSVLYVLAELCPRRFQYIRWMDQFNKIIALARTQRVTKEMTEEIISPTKPELTPERKEHDQKINKEAAITRVVQNDLTTEFGMQAFKNALATMSRQSEEQFLMIVLDVLEEYAERKLHPNRFDGHNYDDGDPDFDAVDCWRRYEATMIKALHDHETIV
jgi:hypothetical protein